MKSITAFIVSLLIIMLCACAEALPVSYNVTDQAGRTITVEEPVERIISGYYISSSLCIALGLSDRLVGIEARAETRPIYALAKPELLELPNVGTARDFNLEACLALKPDLVILPNRLIDSANILSEFDIPVILVNPESFDGIIEMITIAGKAAGVQERAEQLITYIESSRKELEALAAGVTNKPRVYIGGVGSWLSTAPKDMYQSTLVEIAGGINAAGDLTGSGWMEISYEQLFVMNPEVIIIPSEASYDIDDVLSDPAIAEIIAVKNNRVYKMPSDYEAWDSPIPASMLGAKWLINTLHNDLYPDEILSRAIAEFYIEFYNIAA